MRTDLALTEREGRLLALVVREQPVTAYQLYKYHERSPTGSINSSKGQVYPAVERLKRRGLIEGRPTIEDRPNVEELTATDLGVAAVKAWVKSVSPSTVNMDDPLRTRLLSFGLLTREERLEWVANAKRAVRDVERVFEEYNSLGVPYLDLAQKNAVVLLRARMMWLDEVLYEVAAED